MNSFRKTKTWTVGACSEILRMILSVSIVHFGHAEPEIKDFVIIPEVIEKGAKVKIMAVIQYHRNGTPFTIPEIRWFVDDRLVSYIYNPLKEDSSPERDSGVDVRGLLVPKSFTTRDRVNINYTLEYDAFHCGHGGLNKVVVTFIDLRNNHSNSATVNRSRLIGFDCFEPPPFLIFNDKHRVTKTLPVVKEGALVQLTCITKAFPAANISWWFTEEEQKWSADSQNKHLTVKADANAHRSYFCEARQNRKKAVSLSYELVAEEHLIRPDLTYNGTSVKHKDEIWAKNGHIAHLKCTTNHTVDLYGWLFNKRPKLGSYKWDLDVKMTEKTNGEYACVISIKTKAKRKVQLQSQSVYLYTYEKPVAGKNFLYAVGIPVIITTSIGAFLCVLYFRRRKHLKELKRLERRERGSLKRGSSLKHTKGLSFLRKKKRQSLMDTASRRSTMTQRNFPRGNFRTLAMWAQLGARLNVHSQGSSRQGSFACAGKLVPKSDKQSVSTSNVPVITTTAQFNEKREREFETFDCINDRVASTSRVARKSADGPTARTDECTVTAQAAMRKCYSDNDIDYGEIPPYSNTEMSQVLEQGAFGVENAETNNIMLNQNMSKLQEEISMSTERFRIFLYNKAQEIQDQSSYVDIADEDVWPNEKLVTLEEAGFPLKAKRKTLIRPTKPLHGRITISKSIESFHTLLKK